MKTINASDLKKKLDKDEVLLVDVRGVAEHKAEWIDKTYLIPLNEMSIEKLPSTRQPIVIYCKMGQRSADACKKLLAISPSLDVSYLEGGILAWIQEGYPIRKTHEAFLSIERQTQITAGFLALSGILLGALVNSTFYILPGFIGAGLMFAGITGWCGMAKWLAKMPWNQ